MSKDFSILDNEGGVYEAMKEATAKGRKPKKENYTEEEKAEAKRNHTTQGKKGMSLWRINMAFDDDVADFIKTMAKMTGTNMTAFCNKCIREYMNEHIETYQKAVELRKELEK
mgnify:CR=1 FL=1